MDSKKIGAFLAEQRKQKGLTQKELAEQLCVTNKTISKWECGRGIPDSIYLQELAKSLSVSITDILNGEVIQEEQYKSTTEEILLGVMEDPQKKKQRIRCECLCLGILLFLWGGILWMFFLLQEEQMGEISSLWILLDIPTLIIQLIVVIVVSVIAGTIKEIGSGIKLVCFLDRYLSIYDKQKCRDIVQAYKRTIFLVILIGLIFTLGMTVIAWSGRFTIFPMHILLGQEIVILPLLYAFMLVLVLAIIKFKIERGVSRYEKENN